MSVTYNRSSKRQEHPIRKNQVIVLLATTVFSHIHFTLSRPFERVSPKILLAFIRVKRIS